MEPVAPDDALYIGIGRMLWHAQAPRWIDGSVFTIRSWAYPFMIGGMSRLFEGVFGGDPFTGARILGWTFGTTSLALAVVVAFRNARAAGAVATTVVLLATPLLWTVVPSTLVDGTLMCFAVGVLLVVDRPTPRRMLAGGLLAGVTFLVKETSVLFVLLPLAYLGTMPRPEWLRLARRFLASWVLAVGWWFVTVLILKGEIFPLEGFEQAARRDVPRVWSLDATGILLVAAFVVGWLALAIGRRHDARGRLLVLAGAALVPAAIIAWIKALAMRQFSPLVLLSCIALGIAIVDGLAALRRRIGLDQRRALTAVLGVGLLAVALVPIGLTQDRTPVLASAGGIEARITNWIADRSGAPTVVTTFRFRGQVWARLSGEGTVEPMEFQASRHPLPLTPAVWADWRNQRYYALERAELARALRGADWLLLTGPHRFGPIGLAFWLNDHGAGLGFTPARHFGPKSLTSWAYAYRLDHPKVDAIPTVVSTTAAEHMVASHDFRPRGPTAIAGTRGGCFRLRRQVPLDGIEQIEAPLR